MNDLATGHLVLYALVIVVAVPVLDWFESRRVRVARVRARHQGRHRIATERPRRAGDH
jgi:hypothetical protein